MPCLKEISVKLIGSLALVLAKSAIAITAYLPLLVNFIVNKTSFYGVYLCIPTKIVKYRNK